MLERIREKRDEIYAIARKHKAEKLWVFGSCARGEERPDSDVDFLVSFKKGVTLFDMGGLYSTLKELLGCEVDVVDDFAMGHDPFFAYTVRRDMVAL